MGVIVERSSRFVQLLALPENWKLATVRDAIAEKITELPEQLARPLDPVRKPEHPGGHHKKRRTQG